MRLAGTIDVLLVVRLGMAGASSGCDVVFGLDPATIDGAPPEACPATYDRMIAGKAYRYREDPREWAQADEDCRDHSATGVTHLPVFDDLDELQAFRAARAAIQSEPLWVSPVGYARDRSGNPQVFRAVTGGVITRASPLWAINEPTGGATGEETATYVGWDVPLFDAPPLWVNGPEEYLCQCDGVRATEVYLLD